MAKQKVILEKEYLEDNEWTRFLNMLSPTELDRAIPMVKDWMLYIFGEDNEDVVAKMPSNAELKQFILDHDTEINFARMKDDDWWMNLEDIDGTGMIMNILDNLDFDDENVYSYTFDEHDNGYVILNKYERRK